MELRHLRTLDAIARHGSFTRAAEELHLAQSALSQQIRRLEAELGHPGAEIHMVEETADRLLEMLRADELDCAFASVDPDRLGDEFAATMLFEEQIVVAFAAGHPFSALEHVTFEQLAEQALIAYREGSELRRRLEWAMADHDVQPRNAFLCTEMAAVRGLASRGLGVAVLPESIAHMEGEPIEFRPVGPEPLRWPVTIVWRAPRRQPPAAKAFLALALAAAAERADDEVTEIAA